MKMYPNGTYSTVRVGKLLSDMFSIRNDLKQDNFFIAFVLQVLSSMALEGFR
jgi:hypothetical protein